MISSPSTELGDKLANGPSIENFVKTEFYDYEIPEDEAYEGIR